MSVKVMTYIWEHSPQKGSALLTLLAIADHADDTGSAYPGIGRLAKKTRMTVRNVQYVIKKLVESKDLLLHEYQGPNRVHVYQIPIDETKTFQGENFSGVKTFQGETQRHKRVKSSVAHIRNIEPSLEPSEEKKEEKKEEKHTPPPPSQGEASVSGRKKARSPRQKGYSEAFCTFYDDYPRHEDPDDAWKAWQSIDGDANAEEIMTGIAAHRQFNEAWKRREIRYIKKPAAWLRAGSYKSDFARPIKDEEADRARRMKLYEAVERGESPL